MARWIPVCALLIALASAGFARADGDPASDVLFNAPVFFSFTTETSKAAQAALVKTANASKHAGYPIRVAVIETPEDLGAVASLWGKPRQYASFLDYELSLGYAGPLLVVMPAGLGFAHYKHPTAAAYQAIAAVPVASGKDGLALTGQRAVAALAQRAGHPIAVTSTGTGSSSATRWVAIGGGLALVLAAVAAAVVLVRRRRRHYSS